MGVLGLNRVKEDLKVIKITRVFKGPFPLTLKSARRKAGWEWRGL